MRRRLPVVIALLVVVLALAAAPIAPRIAIGVYQRLRGRATVEQRLAQYGPAARERLRPHFERAGVPYPPARVVLLGVKDEKTLHVFAAAPGGELRRITSYPILAASGGPGPKLRRGDRQVPEGVYRVESLNPNSLYHLSLRLNYPNEFDRAMAAADGRTDLGGDIMIHGSTGSVGCLAMGDPASEDLFVLAAETGLENITVVLAPSDPRTGQTPAVPHRAPAWLLRLYETIIQAAADLPR
jgi:hypothetical protein